MTEVLDYFDDILDAAEMIERFTEGMTRRDSPTTRRRSTPCFGTSR